MAEAGLMALHKAPFRPKTTVQDPDRAPAPNRLAEIEAPSQPGEVFVSDITYVATREGCRLHLCSGRWPPCHSVALDLLSCCRAFRIPSIPIKC